MTGSNSGPIRVHARGLGRIARATRGEDRLCQSFGREGWNPSAGTLGSADVVLTVTVTEFERLFRQGGEQAHVCAPLRRKFAQFAAVRVWKDS